MPITRGPWNSSSSASKSALDIRRGEKRAEDVSDLVAAASAVFDELEFLIRTINRTNSATVMADGRTVTDLLAERDVLRLRYSMLKVRPKQRQVRNRMLRLCGPPGPSSSGLLSGCTGARLQSHFPESATRRILGLLILAIDARYAWLAAG